jgi:phosphatidylinositol kinase/protein kinase (PI-3  family)
MGSLAALAYVIGGVDTSPQGLLIDRTHGTVTSARFLVIPNEMPVPFRLTPMVVAAFGTAGVAGPFGVALTEAMRTIRKWSLAIAPFVQFAMGPIGAWGGIPPSGDPDDDADRVYGRIAGKTQSLEKDIAELITRASDRRNYSQMPEQWAANW